MSATDELRRLLDERGVEWKAHGHENRTWWSNNENVGWYAETRPSVRGLYVEIEAVLTPEQAIAATLGNDGVGRTKNGVAERECDQLKAENEQLRELVRFMWYADYAGHFSTLPEHQEHQATVWQRINELGVVE
jgi:hypothetical protein